jgi:hypothetical protein
MLRATRERHVSALFTRLERLNASRDLINLLKGMLCSDADRRLSMLEVRDSCLLYRLYECRPR